MPEIGCHEYGVGAGAAAYAAAVSACAWLNAVCRGQRFSFPVGCSGERRGGRVRPRMERQRYIRDRDVARLGVGLCRGAAAASLH